MSTQFLLSLAIRFAGLARVKRVTIEEKEQPETLALLKPGAMRKNVVLSHYLVRVSYNGHYVAFPRLRRGFDSRHPHQIPRSRP